MMTAKHNYLINKPEFPIKTKVETFRKYDPNVGIYIKKPKFWFDISIEIYDKDNYSFQKL